MASAAKKAKCDSTVDEVISTVRRSYFGKPVDDEYLNFLKSLLENKMAASEGHSTLFDYQAIINLFTTSESPKYSNPPIFCCLQNFGFFLVKSRAKY